MSLHLQLPLAQELRTRRMAHRAREHRERQVERRASPEVGSWCRRSDSIACTRWADGECALSGMHRPGS